MKNKDVARVEEAISHVKNSHDIPAKICTIVMPLGEASCEVRNKEVARAG